MHNIVTVRSIIKAKQEKLYSKADLFNQKWNIQYLAGSTHTLGPNHSRSVCGGGWGVGWQ